MLFQPNLELFTLLGKKSLLNGDLILKPGEYAVTGRGSADEFKKLWGFLPDTKWGNPGTDNLAPVAVNNKSDVNEDDAVKINILSNDHDLDGSLNGSSVEITSDPLHGKITNVNTKTGEVTYEPNNNYHGSDQFKYLVSDDKNKPSNEATVSINVRSVNDAPVANGDKADTGEDIAVEIDVLFNDKDIDGVLIPASVKISKSPANGTTNINTGTGAITYTPATNYNGPDTLSYTVEDDSGDVSNEAVVALTISAQNNDPPVILKLPVVEFNEDNTLTILLSSLYDYVDDPDTPDEKLELKLSGGNNVKTGSDGTNAILSSRINWFGNDTLLLEVSDGQSSDQADMYVIVHSINDVPEITGLPQTLALNADSTVDLMLWQYVSDVETPDNVLKYSFNRSNDSLKYNFDAAIGKLTLSAISGLNHDVTLEISVRDDSAATAKADIIVQVETISTLVDL